MKEIPILFSRPMVQALLKGRKTMTRRKMKPQIKDCNHGLFIEADWKDKPTLWSEDALKVGRAYCSRCGNGTEYSNDFGGIKCPYGQPGDLLWVRETWAPDLAGDDINSYIEYIRYAADESRRPIKWVKDYSSYKNRPGIHMNKEYSRIWLQVIDVRVERLQDISESDAKAEGIEKMDESPFPYKLYSCNTASCVDAKTSFKFLWQDINGDDAWLNNPWVWVISFKVLSTTGKPSTITP